MASNVLSISLIANIKQFVSSLKSASDTVEKTGNEMRKTSTAGSSLASVFDKLGKNDAVINLLDEITGGYGSKILQLGSDLSNAFGGAADGAKKLSVTQGRALVQLTGGFDKARKAVVGIRIALVAVRAAIIATGIGALIVAAVVLVQVFKQIRNAATGISGEIRAQTKLLAKQRKDQEVSVKRLNNSTNLLKLQGKTQTEINNLKIVELKSLLAIQLAQIANTTKALEGAQKQRDAYLALAKFIVNTLVNAFGVVFKLQAKFFDKFFIIPTNFSDGIELALQGAANAFTDFIVPDLGIPDLTKEIDETTDSVIQLENTIAGLQIANIIAARKALTAINSGGDFKPNKVQALTVEDPLTQIKSGFEGVSAFLNQKIAETQQKIDFLRAQANTVVVEVGDLLQNAAFAGLSGIGDAIGNALASGANAFEAAGGALIGAISGFLGQLGDRLIQVGLAAKALDAVLALIGTPGGAAAAVAAIALGVALKAASSALQSTASAGIGGGGGGGARGSSGGGSNISQSTSFAGQGGGRVVFEIAGDKLIGVINNSVSSSQRIGAGTNID